MIDIHSHVLPGIDDGAEDLPESVAMCRRAAEDGCTAIIATPHQRHRLWWNAESDDLHQLRGLVQSELDGEIQILGGAEIRVDSELLDDLDAGVTTPLAGSRYLLVEFARSGFGPVPEDTIHELSVAGWRPILAHPELLPWLAEDIPRLTQLVELGALLQITAMSVTGEFGQRPQRAVHGLLEARLPHFMASDCHGMATRPPGLSAARELVSQRWGSELAQRLTEIHPRAILEDSELPPW
ncbi:MAG: CpsB/CapC family capsule biosynthesis tyrosine phosphatase [Acidobacteriota bacterium]|nr:CpsB/CapC family capsule biosynthesis tyrosine phosphatase [Acidobacteriota bacterium]